MISISSRRKFITGLAALIAAPALVRASSLMAVHTIQPAPKVRQEYWWRDPSRSHFETVVVEGFDQHGGRRREVIHFDDTGWSTGAIRWRDIVNVEIHKVSVGSRLIS